MIADYGVNTLGKKKWAIVHSTEAFGTNGMKNLVEALKRTGAEPVLIQGYTVGKTAELVETDFIQTVFPHPTLSEMMHESVLAAFGRVIHI